MACHCIERKSTFGRAVHNVNSLRAARKDLAKRSTGKAKKPLADANATLQLFATE